MIKLDFALAFFVYFLVVTNFPPFTLVDCKKDSAFRQVFLVIKSYFNAQVEFANATYQLNSSRHKHVIYPHYLSGVSVALNRFLYDFNIVEQNVCFC